MKKSSTGGTNSEIMNEPLIVVEESGGIAEEEEEEEESKPSSADESPSNQYLLTPWRDMRKRSLPTPPCTSGITASQVRRLSERGGEGSGPSPIEQAFLATLSQAPAPAPGARRHSVVTISRAPPTTTIFGRNRRESIAALTGFTSLPRKDSATNQARGSIGGTGSNSGSSFNLQLDIMDDITEAKAKAKERRKLYRSQSKELADESGTNPDNTLSAGFPKGFDRRYSDFTSTTKTAQSLVQKRRASELLPLNFNSLSNKKPGPGIVCSNTDLISILSPLTSSAQEISSDVNAEKEPQALSVNPNTGSPTQSKTVADKKKRQLKDRSNSFDVGYLPGTSSNPASWFTNRHQPMSKKEPGDVKSNIIVTFTDEKQKPKSSLVFTTDRSKPAKSNPEIKKSSPTIEKVVWDNKSGSVVDPQLIGTAIEVFLNQKTCQESSPPVGKTSPKDSPTKTGPAPTKTWFGTNNPDPGDEEASSDARETSICSTLKDLFVK